MKMEDRPENEFCRDLIERKLGTIKTAAESEQSLVECLTDLYTVAFLRGQTRERIRHKREADRDMEAVERFLLGLKKGNGS